MQLRLNFSKKNISLVLYAFCGVAVALTLAQHILQMKTPFSFVSADVSTMARSFARHGVVKLGGVPINNNDPLGNSPAVYVHWPPLLPILLSGLFRWFGESEATAYALMTVVLFATASILYLIARCVLPPEGGCFAFLFYLTMPVVLNFSPKVSQQALAILFMVLALFAFLRATSSERMSRTWIGVACMATCLAIWSSWEPASLSLCLLAVAAWRKNERELRLAKRLVVVSLIALGLLAAVYASQAPSAALDAFRTLKFRMGLSHTYTVNPLQHHAPTDQLGWGRIVRNLLHFYPEMLGVIGIAAVIWLILTAIDRLRSRSMSPAAIVFAGLLGPWLIWYGTMWNHVGVHKMEMLLAAPGTAMAMAYVATGILVALQNQGEGVFWRAFGLVIIVPVLCLVPLTHAVRQCLVYEPNHKYLGFLPAVKPAPSLSAPNWNVRFANLVHSSTPPDAIIFMPLETVAPVFYSDRHLIRNITNDDVLAQTLPFAQRAFPDSPFFLAVPTKTVSLFPQSIARSDLVAQTDEEVVYKLHSAVF